MNEKLKNGDFKKYYDTTQKRNYWVLGYFGGGAVPVNDAYKLAQEYAISTNVTLDSVCIDEILSSRRFKGFKFLFSTETQNQEEDSEAMVSVHQWLRD